MGRPTWLRGCTEACEVWPTCTTCGHSKAPHGRSLPLEMCNGYCDRDCPGYHQPPEPGHLFPGELAQYDAEDEFND